MRGRKNKQDSRAAQIRARLAVWRQTPEAKRISLRPPAVEFGTSHRLLSFYLRGLDEWQSREYRRKSKEIRDRAEAEERALTPIEQGQVAALDRAHVCTFADYIASAIISGCLQKNAARSFYPALETWARRAATDRLALAGSWSANSTVREDWDQQLRRRFGAGVLKVSAKADAVVRAALFLCSNQSSAITGQSINVNGGAAFF